MQRLAAIRVIGPGATGAMDVPPSQGGSCDEAHRRDCWRSWARWRSQPASSPTRPPWRPSPARPAVKRRDVGRDPVGPRHRQAGGAAPGRGHVRAEAGARAPRLQQLVRDVGPGSRPPGERKVDRVRLGRRAVRRRPGLRWIAARLRARRRSGPCRRPIQSAPRSSRPPGDADGAPTPAIGERPEQGKRVDLVGLDEAALYRSSAGTVVTGRAPGVNFPTGPRPPVSARRGRPRRRVRLAEEPEQRLAGRLVQPDPITPGPPASAVDLDLAARRRRCGWFGS